MSIMVTVYINFSFKYQSVLRFPTSFFSKEKRGINEQRKKIQCTAMHQGDGNNPSIHSIQSEIRTQAYKGTATTKLFIDFLLLVFGEESGMVMLNFFVISLYVIYMRWNCSYKRGLY